MNWNEMLSACCAFDDIEWSVRCVFRYWSLPNDGYGNLGFRVVVSLA